MFPDRIKTAKQKLDEAGGSGPGFDAWRLALSIIVMFLHTFFVCYGRFSHISQSVGFYGRPAIVAVLPIFFGLSGFLVAASAERAQGVAQFLAFRGFRLIPALAVETTLAALLVGPFVTTQPLRSYFTDHHFFAYFGNIVGRVRYELPGVFETSMEPGTVNLNLWTLHAELECYAILAIAIFIGLLRKRNAAIGIWIAATIFLIVWNAVYDLFETPGLYPTWIFVYAFCTCVVAYQWRDKIPISRALFIIVVLVYLAIVYLPHAVYPAVILMSYIMIYVGLSPAFRLKLPGDYSYGIYLYGFVLTQFVAWALPEHSRIWWIVFPVALALTFGFSALSWHIIEKPALRLKRWWLKNSMVKPDSSSPLLPTPRPDPRTPSCQRTDKVAQV